MRCSICQSENADGSRFCRSCGTALLVTCTRCGHQNDVRDAFCPSCGQANTQIDSQMKAADHGERKLATVLFADIVGSTQLIADLDPELAMERLRPAVAAMGQAVQRYDGTIARTLGDGVMALFGIPFAQEAHALLACKAALAMQAALAGEEGLAIRVGIHSGEVVSGFEEELTRERAAHGPVIHMASRLEHMAEPGGIYISEDTFRLVRPYCDAQLLGQHEIRGFARPIGVFRLLGLRPAVASQQFRRAGLGTYRGREREMQILEEALNRAERGEGLAIGISASPGLGKSRLCFEFSEWCRGQLVTVLEARAPTYGYAGPLQAILEFLRSFFRISPQDDAETARARIAWRLNELNPELTSELPILSEFLGVAEESGALERLDPKVRRARLRNAVIKLLRMGGHSLSVILIEDVHWLDEASQEFVPALVEAVRGTNLLLLLNYRSVYKAAWMNSPGFTEIELDELDGDDVVAMIEERIGRHPSTRDIRKQVAERSGGNPFFAEELIRTLIDSGTVWDENGRYIAAHTAGADNMPSTVQSVVGARIDRLEESEKRVLQIGAIIGREFPLAVLEPLAGVSPETLLSILGRLCDTEFLHRDGTEQRPSYAFQHPLVQEVAYVTQLRSRRIALHAAVARALESYHADRAEEFASVIAHHYEAAGEPATAASYAARAAFWVGSRDAGQALKYWRKVHALLEGEPRKADTDPLRILASGQIINFGWREGMSAAEAAPYVERALALAREAENISAQMLLLAGYGRILTATGSADGYVAQVREAQSLLAPKADAGQKALISAFLCQAYSHAGRLREALAANNEAMLGVASVNAFEERVLGFNVERWVRSLKGSILVNMGRFDEAAEELHSLIADEMLSHDPTVQFIPHMALVEMAWLRNDGVAAHSHSARVRQIAAESDIPYLLVHADAAEGLAKSIAGDQAGAIAALTQAMQYTREARVALDYEPEILANLAEVYRRAGALDDAARGAREAIEIAQKRAVRLSQCRATLTLAAALAGREDGDAGALAQEADRLIEDCGALYFRQLPSALALRQIVAA